MSDAMKHDMEDSNLVKARSSLVWMLAILIAFGAVWWIERETGKELIAKQEQAAHSAAARCTPDATPSASTQPAQSR